MPNITRLSNFFLPTLLTDQLPRAVLEDTVPVSHRLLVKAGYIKAVHYVL